VRPRATDPAAGGRHGQTLVEFALVIPIFLIIFISVIEFGFMLNATLAVNFATRDAALIAAEAGNADLADCTILRYVENDISEPLSDAQIQSVTIYQADRAGQPVPGVQNVYTRSGSTECVFSATDTVDLPYTATSSAYPTEDRCNELAGCAVDGSPGVHVPLDSIGVRVTYRYPYHTPIGNLLPFLPGASTGYLDFTWANVMRMEPIL
jgi:Flp pilus assembly protein TadG